jgi:peptide/nickel transport system permease protein
LDGADVGAVGDDRHGPLSAGAGKRLRQRTGRAFGSPVARVVVRRLILAVPLLFIVSALSFLLISLKSGDAASQILGTDATPESVAALRHQLGLDRPLYEQYGRWVGHALHGDLGTSLLSGEPVTKIVNDRYSVTLSLVGLSLLATVVVGVTLGILSAVRGGVLGRLVDGLSLVGYALPGFWVGAILISLFAVKLGWFPAIGYVPLGTAPNDWARSLVLPVAAIALQGTSLLVKQTREAMLDVLGSEHVRMAWANGIPSRAIYFKLGLKTASVQIVTVVGLQVVILLGSTIFVEQVFVLPGLGSALVNATVNGDIPVVQALTVMFTLIIVMINLVVDVAYTLLNPRVRTS